MLDAQIARLAEAVRGIAAEQVTTEVAPGAFFSGAEKARILNAAADELENAHLTAAQEKKDG